MEIDIIAKWIVVLFGLFLIGVGFLMLFSPTKVRKIIRKAGSTNFINYAEISIRMIPAAALVWYADLSMFPVAFWILGWFMLATSMILFFVPRRIHHAYAVWCADWLKPEFIRLLFPISILMGSIFIYSVIQ